MESNIFKGNKNLIMAEVIDFSSLDDFSDRLREDKKVVVLVGGCFDIIHIGHVRFLRKARGAGDILVVALESDEKTKRLKGKDRPINNQEERAEVLSNLSMVDYVIKLEDLKTDSDYLRFTQTLKPNVLAVTRAETEDLKRKNSHIERVAKAIGAEFIEVIPYLTGSSTSRLAKIIGID